MVTRPISASIFLFATTIFSINAGFWQIARRRWKEELVGSQHRMYAAPSDSLPPNERANYARLELKGVLDNEGSMLVGPRPQPARSRGSSSQEARGGFLVMTPFELAATGEVILINRGFVPIEACRSRLLLARYIGEAFVPATIQGVVRPPESQFSFFGGESAENKAPMFRNTWAVVRPREMALDYFKRRFGSNRVEAQERYGVRDYVLEMLEDHSGNDQVLVHETAYPMRRTEADIAYQTISPGIHLMYAVFWFAVSAGCLYGIHNLRAATQLSLKAKYDLAKVRLQVAERKTDRELQSAAVMSKLEGFKQGKIFSTQLNVTAPAEAVGVVESGQKSTKDKPQSTIDKDTK